MVDSRSIEQAVRTLLRAIGEDPEREGLRETPARFARMCDQIFAGLHQDPNQFLKAVFDEKHHEVVLVKDIPFHSVCEHHLLPFEGSAHVAYIPNGKVIGISKIARIVDCFARRPQLQERMTSQIADFLDSGISPKGVAVVIEATHSCMTMRGVQKPGSAVVTSALRGTFLSNLSSREEVLSLIQRHRGG